MDFNPERKISSGFHSPENPDDRTALLFQRTG